MGKTAKRKMESISQSALLYSCTDSGGKRERIHRTRNESQRSVKVSSASLGADLVLVNYTKNCDLNLQH